MAGNRPSSRGKILAAAADLACEAGPGSLSLEAVAQRAGVSKGGLLYNFPTKAKLLQGLVEDYLDGFEAALDAATDPENGGESLLEAYVRLSLEETCQATEKPATWIFTAMAEDPDFVRPINAFRQRVLGRLRADAADRTAMLATFLAVEGLRCMKLFGSEMLTEDEREALKRSLLAGVATNNKRN